MLVLSRHQDEIIRIGDEVKIVIVRIKDDKVRVGIDAPRDVKVHREEVYQAIQRSIKRSEHGSGQDAEGMLPGTDAFLDSEAGA